MRKVHTVTAVDSESHMTRIVSAVASEETAHGAHSQHSAHYEQSSQHSAYSEHKAAHHRTLVQPLPSNQSGDALQHNSQFQIGPLAVSVIWGSFVGSTIPSSDPPVMRHEDARVRRLIVFLHGNYESIDGN